MGAGDGSCAHVVAAFKTKLQQPLPASRRYSRWGGILAL